MAKTCLWHFTCKGSQAEGGRKGELNRKAAVACRQAGKLPAIERRERWSMGNCQVNEYPSISWLNGRYFIVLDFFVFESWVCCLPARLSPPLIYELWLHIQIYSKIRRLCVPIDWLLIWAEKKTCLRPPVRHMIGLCSCCAQKSWVYLCLVRTERIRNLVYESKSEGSRSKNQKKRKRIRKHVWLGMSHTCSICGINQL